MEQATDNDDVPSFDEFGEEVTPAEPLNSIIMSNVKDLTVHGLKNLCRNYGAVVDVQKHAWNPNVAFIKFATESDATIAIQQLNSKLGFGYRADFARPKCKFRAPKGNDKPVKLVDDGEDWEQASVRRRFNFGLMPPLHINFPDAEPLCTKANYLSAVEGPLLRQVDPELFFSVQNVVVDAGMHVKEPVTDDRLAGRQKRLDAYAKTSAGGQFYADRNVFIYSELNEKELAAFGSISHCAACGGLGFVYCPKCGTHYCSAAHQLEHMAKHDSVCRVKSNNGKPEEVTLDRTSTTPDGTTCGNVLTRDPLPEKVNVYITAVLTPNGIFVRSADRGVERDYFQTIADCERASLTARTAIDTGAELAVGGIYLAPNAAFGVDGRVLLVEVGLEESKCVFIEHGTVSYVGNDTLKLIDDPALRYRKVCVYKVCLADITDELGETEKAMAYLRRLKKQPLEMRHRVEAGNMVGVQLRTGGGESVNETVNRLIIIPPILTDKDHESYVMYKDIPQSIPSLGTDKRIMILNRTTIQYDARVTWIAMDDLPYLERLQDKLQHYGKKVSEFQRYYTPRIGELCLVRCLDRWYRAVCHETAGDCKPALFLCDYGCMVLANLTDIRQLPAQFAKVVRTHDGIVRGLAEAKADGGLVLDSDILDVYLPENEPLVADIAQEKRQDSLLACDESELYTILNMHECSFFLESLKRPIK